MSATTFWRLAGLSYLEYAAKATTTLRTALKEPARTAALGRESVKYNRNVFVEGKPTGKVTVTSMKGATEGTIAS